MPEAQLKVRPADRRDIDTIAALVADAFAHYRRVLPAHIFDPYLADSCDFGSRWEEGEIAILQAEDGIVGTITYYADASREGMGWPSDVAGLRTLAVAPRAQGMGCGRALCRWCIDRARQDGFRALTLHTAAFMLGAVRLYESVGFDRVPGHDMMASDVLGFSALQGDQKILANALNMDVPD